MFTRSSLDDTGCEDYQLSFVFFSDAEKGLFAFLEEVFNYDSEEFMSALRISLEVLLDIHLEERSRKKYLTETIWGSRKENLVTILNSDRWNNFKYPYEKWGIEFYFGYYSFNILNQIMIIGGYNNYRDVLLLATRLLYVLFVQNSRGIPVNSYYKLYKTQTSQFQNSNGFIYENVAEEIEVKVLFH